MVTGGAAGMVTGGAAGDWGAAGMVTGGAAGMVTVTGGCWNGDWGGGCESILGKSA